MGLRAVGWLATSVVSNCGSNKFTLVATLIVLVVVMLVMPVVLLTHPGLLMLLLALIVLLFLVSCAGVGALSANNALPQSLQVVGLTLLDLLRVDACADCCGSLAYVPTPSACSFDSVSGSKGADSALYITPDYTLCVTLVLGCTIGSPSLSVCFSSLYYLVEELVVLSRFWFT